MASPKFDIAFAAGVLLVLIMTIVSISQAKDRYPDATRKLTSAEEEYITSCKHNKTICTGKDLSSCTDVTYSGVDSGDTALMMFGTTLVMFQTPAMGIAQAGMIRRKNSLSMMMQCVSGMAIGSLLWFVCGYSLTFGPDKGGIIGDPVPFFFFHNMPRSNELCLSIAPSIPGPLFASFQMMFALMVPVIVTGAWAEKMKMEAFVVFMVLWPLLVYYPVAHWVWGGGWMAELGAIDFAGGITIHTTAGVAAMVVSKMLQPRRNVEKLAMTHHNVGLLVIGGVIIWAGWYSFNGCSALAGNASAGAALLNTHISASVAGLTWVLLTYRRDGCFHVTDMLNGAFAGLAGITPGSGFVPSQAAFCYGIVIGVASYYSAGFCKDRLKIDDVLDVFSLQAVPGGIGSILCGIFAGGEPYALEGWSADRSKEDNLGLAFGGNGRLLGVQILCVLVTAVECAIMTYIIMKIMEMTVGTDITWEEEDAGLDKAQIGEIGYDYISPQDTVPLDDNALTADLIEAAAAGNMSKCRNLVKAGADPKRADYDGRSPLHLAAAEGRLEIVKWLQPQLDGNLNPKDNFGGTPTEDAVGHGHAEVIEYLLSHGGTVDQTKHAGMICDAAFDGNCDRVQKLVTKHKVQLDSKDYDLRTALHVAAANGQSEVVRTMLALARENNQARALLDAKDRWGQTAMDEAKKNMHVACQQLLENPDSASLQTATTTKKSKNTSISPVSAETTMNTATKELLELASSGNLKQMMVLAKRDANCGCTDYDGRTPLHIAASNGFLEMIRFLAAQKGVSINATDRFGVTPLMETIRKGHTEASNLLKSIGGAPSVDQRSGFALCNAAANNNMDALQELHLSGVDLGTADYDGRTALHLAASNGNSSVVQWLIKRSDDINVNIVDAMCNTALDDAVRGKHVDIERMIAAVGGKKSKDMFNPLSTTLRNTNNNLAKISSTSTAEGTSLDSV